jgi:hypothetical protein
MSRTPKPRWIGGAALLLCLVPVAQAAPATPAPPGPIVGHSAFPAEGAQPAHLAQPGGVPTYLPRYTLDMDLDLCNHVVHVRQESTWVNPHCTPTQQVVFNAHSRFVVPAKDIGFMAKTLEILRVQAGDALGYKDPPLEVHKVTLATKDGPALPFRYEGDTQTALVVDLPRPVAPGESVTVVLDETLTLPNKMGRWGYWEGVTFLSNWLPVFAFYGDPRPRASTHVAQAAPAVAPRVVRAGAPAEEGQAPPSAPPSAPAGGTWQPTPFIPWHQPFFNESGIYHVTVTLPCDQEIACSGKVVSCTKLPDGRQRVEIHAIAVREFTLLCSARYRVWETCAKAGPGGAPVRVRILALPQHEFYAEKMLRIATDALQAYSKWFGPYPWPDFTIAEAFFGWNGNECSTLVMIDERVFSCPHVAVGYVEYLVSHEICHQWWYNLVGTNGYCETWMDEAMASYFSHRLLNDKHGRNNAIMTYPAGLEWLPNIRREDYRSYGMYGTFGRGENTPIVQEMPKFGHLVNLFNLCYDKGSRVVGMIEERLGECAFMEFTHLIVTKYRYRILRVADYQHELEEYTGASPAGQHFAWEEFFQNWLYGKGMTDWAIAKVKVTPPAHPADGPAWSMGELFNKVLSPDEAPNGEAVEGKYHVEVWVEQRAEVNEQTTLGFAMAGSKGYPIRVPLVPGGASYALPDLSAHVTMLPPGKKGGACMKVDIDLPTKPTEIAVDPDQVIVDVEPTNNFWHLPVRWRFAPLYTFLEETDLTSAYDKWNVIYGPWIYAAAYQEPWFTRSTMAGFRAGVYRTQQFNGGVYTGYRTDFRDVVAGVDGVWDHVLNPHLQLGFIAERRLAEVSNGDHDAMRAVGWARYILTYGSSLYLPPFQYVDLFAYYTDNFLPFTTEPIPGGVRYDRTTTMGVHYRINYLTPYWDPEGGFQFEARYECGVAESPSSVGVHLLSGQLSFVKSPPSLTCYAPDGPLHDALEWLADTRFAFRAYGATAAPQRGEFFTMGSDLLFRGFDMAQRQGSTVWVGSVEWRLPVARRVDWDCVDHVIGLRNAYVALFYDAGDAYINGRQVGSVAHALGAGLRLDVAWFSFVERTTVRLDVAKSINTDTGFQVWVGINHPF